MILISNATPLIYLGKLNQLQLMTNIAEKVVSTIEVRDEVLVSSTPEYPALRLFFNNDVELKEPSGTYINQDLFETSNIHKGELSILNLAFDYREIEYSLVIDDRAARNLAKAFYLNYTGTIGIILRNHMVGYLQSQEAIDLLDELILKTSFRLSNRLYIQI